MKHYAFGMCSAKQEAKRYVYVSKTEFHIFIRIFHISCNLFYIYTVFVNINLSLIKVAMQYLALFAKSRFFGLWPLIVDITL